MGSQLTTSLIRNLYSDISREIMTYLTPREQILFSRETLTRPLSPTRILRKSSCSSVITIIYSLGLPEREDYYSGVKVHNQISASEWWEVPGHRDLINKYYPESARAYYLSGPATCELCIYSLALYRTFTPSEINSVLDKNGISVYTDILESQAIARAGCLFEEYAHYRIIEYPYILDARPEYIARLINAFGKYCFFTTPTPTVHGLDATIINFTYLNYLFLEQDKKDGVPAMKYGVCEDYQQIVISYYYSHEWYNMDTIYGYIDPAYPATHEINFIRVSRQMITLCAGISCYIAVA